MTSEPSPSQTEKRIVVGKIATAHGVKGLVKILPFCEDIDLIEMAEEFTITLKNPSGKYILAEIEGVNSREDVDAIKGTELTISRDQLPEPEDGEYYIEDLVGLLAINAQSGKDAGVIIAVHNFGAGDLLEIKPKSGGETYLLPFNDDHVPEIGETSVQIIPLEGGIG